MFFSVGWKGGKTKTAGVWPFDQRAILKVARCSCGGGPHNPKWDFFLSDRLSVAGRSIDRSLDKVTDAMFVSLSLRFTS